MARRKRFPHANGPPEFVLHTSVALPWVVRDVSNIYSSDVLNALVRTTAIVPESWLIDLAEVAMSFELDGWYSAARVSEHLMVLDGYPILVDDETNRRAWSDIFHLARTYSIPVHSAAYLELALRLKLPLATTDATLSRSALVAGVPIYTP